MGEGQLPPVPIASCLEKLGNVPPLLLVRGDEIPCIKQRFPIYPVLWRVPL